MEFGSLRKSVVYVVENAGKIPKLSKHQHKGRLNDQEKKKEGD